MRVEFTQNTHTPSCPVGLRIYRHLMSASLPLTNSSLQAPQLSARKTPSCPPVGLLSYRHLMTASLPLRFVHPVISSHQLCLPQHLQRTIESRPTIRCRLMLRLPSTEFSEPFYRQLLLSVLPLLPPIDSRPMRSSCNRIWQLTLPTTRRPPVVDSSSTVPFLYSLCIF